MRVVSVLPSATETVFALGHGSELVARSAECDYPPEATRLPVVMRPKVSDAHRPSREIDERVRRARGRGESLYELEVDLLRRLAPDLLLTQNLCGVCSVTEAEVVEACSRAGVAPKVVSLTPRTLEEVWESVRLVGRALGDEQSAARLLRTIHATLPPPPPVSNPPRVVVAEWLDPPILAGLWTAEVVALAGGSSTGPPPGEPGVRTTWEELASERTDLLVLSPCSFSVERTLQELSEASLRASVETVRPRLGTFVADEAYFSRPGPRLAEGVRLVRGLLRGELVRPPMPVRALRTTPESAAA